jgi:hypothetical protein
MKEACGEGWATRQIKFRVPQVLWEEVVDLDTGKVLEVYPCVYPGSRLMTLLEVKKHGVPDWDVEIEAIRDHMKSGRLEEVRRQTSERLGHEVAAGGLAFDRKPDVGTGSTLEMVKGEQPEIKTRDDLSDQIARVKAVAGL